MLRIGLWANCVRAGSVRAGFVRAGFAGGLVVAAAFLVACTAAVPGVDGDLTNDWPTQPEVKVFMPSATVCHASQYTDVGRSGAYRPVDCSQAHHGETVFVGEFTGAAAALERPPEPTAAVVAGAFAVCDAEATAYVGEEWRNGRLTLDMTVPSAVAWAAGARWFRCELNELTTITGEGEWQRRTGSLRDGLPAELKLRCFEESGDDGLIESMPEVECGKPHNAEYVGTFPAPADRRYPQNDEEWDYLHSNCRRLVAEFVGVSQDDADDWGVISWPYSRDGWVSGDHGVRCFLWLDHDDMVGSAQNSAGHGVPR